MNKPQNAADPLEPQFNRDIGMNGDDDAYLRRHYPAIAEFLIWPRLREAFDVHESAAKSLKVGSRRSSFFAITAIILSLIVTLLTTSELLRPFFAANPMLGKILGAVALILLLIALALGKGVLFGRRRDRWLANRIAAERVRQFYFQYLLSRSERICTAGSVEKRQLMEERERELERMLKHVRDPGYGQSVRDDGSLEEARLVALRGVSLPEDTVICADQLKDFWTEMRFEWQSKYANLQRRRSASALPIFGSLEDQQTTVKALEFTATLGIVALQLMAVVIQFTAPSDTASVQIPVLLASLLAIMIVGLQAYADGLNLGEDNSRNRAYAVYTAKLLRDFKEARAGGDGRAQFRAMREMEDLAYFEMQQFLHVHSASKFSL